MPRDRHQRGWVEETGKRVKKWKGHYYVYVALEDGSEVRRHRSVVLGLKSRVRKWEAQQELERVIERETGSRQSRPDDSVSLEWFVRERYLPMREGSWRSSTKTTNADLLKHHVRGPLGSYELRELDKFVLQRHLNTLGAEYSFSVVDHVRNFLKSILEEAVELDYIGKNPARRLVNPETRRPSRPVLTFEQLRRLLLCLNERDRLVVLVASVCALRPGELFALRWRALRDGALEIAETVYRGKVRNVAKTRGSVAPVILPEAISLELEAWRLRCGSPPPEALIFPTANGTPLLKENFIRRSLKPAGKRAGCEFVNFQALRRTFATLAHDSGASLKDVQTQLRHAHAATTADVYTQAIPESVRRAVDAFTRQVLGGPPDRVN